MAVLITSPLRFTRRATVSGGLGSNFVFESEASLQHWQQTGLPLLEQKYGPLAVTISELPGLTVGDTCRVVGEGDEEFVIESLIRYAPNRYGFCLNSGCNEEVAKCYRP